MEAFQEMWTWAMANVFPHWPGVAFCLFVVIFAQVMKSRIFTVDLAVKSKVVYWIRRVFPLFLLALGLLPGFTWPGEVVPGIDTTVEKMWYFVGCSGLTIIGFNVFKQWVKKKYDVDIRLSSFESEE